VSSTAVVTPTPGPSPIEGEGRSEGAHQCASTAGLVRAAFSAARRAVLRRITK